MKHLLKKFEIDGLFAVLMLAFACVSMWGCMGCSEEKVIDRGVNVQKFAILNDSTLVLFVEYWDEVEFYSEYIQGQEEKTNIVDSKIVLVNPYKNVVYDVLNDENKLSSNWTQISDSTVFYFSEAFKKINYFNCNEAHYYKNVLIVNLFKDERDLLNVDTTSFDSCDYYTRWKEGNLKDFSIAISDVGLCKSSQQGTFFLYDLKQKIIRKWIPSGNSAWIAECNDIRWTEKQFRCLMAKGDIFLFDENKNVLDSLAKGSYQLDVSANYSLRFYGNYIGVGHHIYKMYDDGKIGDQPLFEIDLDLWSNGGAYIHLSNGELVSYTKEQLRKD
ncbi:MAG: hypothetical protein J6Q11_10235 [Fibrobacteraceae bacterium]|nr:hypothetical protein [Fibrobacteraceae bacterium]